MIIKGNPAGNVGYWSKHLLRDDTNARAEVKEISGLLAEDLPSALREMQAIAAQSRSHGNFMYQANINPYDHEHLTPEQWKEAVATLEKNLGLEGHQRVVVEHFKEGRQHYHIVWNRVDVDSLRVADMGGNYRIHTATARELESRFDLTPTPTQPAPDRKPALELWEVRAAERSGIDPAALKAELSELWRSTDSGKAFAAALDERGYVLAKGDRRDFCVIDQAGDAHSLARRLDGVKAKDVRERMADVPRDRLPTVAEAREAQRTRPPLAHQPELEQTTVAPAAAPAPKPQDKPSPEIAPAPEIARPAAQPTDQPPAASLGKTAGEIRILWNVSASAESFAAALDERGMSLARVDGDEAAASQRAHAFARALGNYAPRYDEGQIVVVTSFGNVHKLNERTTGQTADAIEKRLGTLDPAALLNVTDTRAVMKEAARVEFYEQRQTARDLTPMEAKNSGLAGRGRQRRSLCRRALPRRHHDRARRRRRHRGAGARSTRRLPRRSPILRADREGGRACRGQPFRRRASPQSLQARSRKRRNRLDRRQPEHSGAWLCPRADRGRPRRRSKNQGGKKRRLLERAHGAARREG